MWVVSARVVDAVRLNGSRDKIKVGLSVLFLFLFFMCVCVCVFSR